MSNKIHKTVAGRIEAHFTPLYAKALTEFTVSAFRLK
jgi:hypothetical protein